MDKLTYLYRNFLNVDGDFVYDTDRCDAVLDNCDSMLEQSVIAGTLLQLQMYYRRCTGMSPHLMCHDNFTIHTDESVYGNLSGIWFFEPWWLWNENGVPGPSALALIPQMPFSHGHHDIGVAYSDDNSGRCFMLEYAIEVDGYHFHKNRRNKDEYRDINVPYKVYRYHEEYHNQLDFFHNIAIQHAEGLYHE